MVKPSTLDRTVTSEHYATFIHILHIFILLFDYLDSEEKQYLPLCCSSFLLDDFLWRTLLKVTYRKTSNLGQWPYEKIEAPLVNADWTFAFARDLWGAEWSMAVHQPCKPPKVFLLSAWLKNESKLRSRNDNNCSWYCDASLSWPW